MEPIVLSATSYFLIFATLVVCSLILVEHVRSRAKRSSRRSSSSSSAAAIYDSEVPILPEAPGPKPWPIFGSLHLLGKYEVPYMAFADLAATYKSQVIKIRMGSFPCVVVNGLENIKEVLTTKGCHFDSRPNFARYHRLFCGDKENSLAFCDWSELQKSRRETLRAHTFPRAFTAKYNQLNAIITTELDTFLGHLDTKVGVECRPKHLILHACANIFTNYFCSRRFDLGHPAFAEMIENFDKIFYEVNQGYAADFVPSLMPFHSLNMARMAKWSREIRRFVSDNVITDRYAAWTGPIEERDYIDCLINHVRTGAQPAMTWNTGLFALEDIIGGHSAIGNLFIKVLGFLAKRPEVQENARKEIDAAQVTGKTVGLEHRGSMPYTEAIILETIRLIASPIVPHVANQDSSIAGYRVEKDTFIFLNNYELNMSERLWDSPTEFIPERFIKNGRISKPDHFLPFGGGRRSCMGYKMVQYLGFSTLATILKNYKITPAANETYKVPIGDLAMAGEAFKFVFERR